MPPPIMMHNFDNPFRPVTSEGLVAGLPNVRQFHPLAARGLSFL